MIALYIGRTPGKLSFTRGLHPEIGAIGAIVSSMPTLDACRDGKLSMADVNCH
ncbi:hypothetical protein [Caballeronia sp. LZ035]|uniref:hypothetical protein n=1 Tax=Caballeronia sp. LZ035 TaxID=3038568 RepID=UPI0028639DF5|nr:hypothetical protein [Caballeronia sp. LZ035]MDR5755447.1 hypothetical protein [Caballeronia sp. LZ035]